MSLHQFPEKLHPPSPASWCSPSRCLPSPLRGDGSCQGRRYHYVVIKPNSRWSGLTLLICEQRLTAAVTLPESHLYCSSSLSSASFSSITDVRPALLHEDFSFQSLLPHPFIFHRCYPIKSLDPLTLSRHALPRGPAPREPLSPSSKP